MTGRRLLIVAAAGVVALVVAVVVFRPSFDFLPHPEGKAIDKFD